MQPDQCGFLFKQIHDALEKHSNNLLRGRGLTSTQSTVLSYLDERPDKQATLKELEKYLKVAQSTTVGIVKRLEEKGFVETSVSPSDKRIKIAKITGMGTLCVIYSQQEFEDSERMILSGFTTNEKKAVKSYLKRILNNIQ